MMMTVSLTTAMTAVSEEADVERPSVAEGMITAATPTNNNNVESTWSSLVSSAKGLISFDGNNNNPGADAAPSFPVQVDVDSIVDDREDDYDLEHDPEDDDDEEWVWTNSTSIPELFDNEGMTIYGDEEPTLLKGRFRIIVSGVMAQRWSGKDISTFDMIFRVRWSYLACIGSGNHCTLLAVLTTIVVLNPSRSISLTISLSLSLSHTHTLIPHHIVPDVVFISTGTPSLCDFCCDYKPNGIKQEAYNEVHGPHDGIFLVNQRDEKIEVGPDDDDDDDDDEGDDEDGPDDVDLALGPFRGSNSNRNKFSVSSAGDFRCRVS